MTASGPMSVPNRRDATFATASARLSSDPSEAIVAEVPMQIGSLSGEHLSRRRRTRTATSAPWRPRYVWSSSRMMNSRPDAFEMTFESRSS
ncbi:hypothetical protein D3C77_333640 [compost metagenome]